MAVVAKLADRDPKSVLQHCTKASEELGELSEAVLAFTGAPGMAYKNLAPEAVLEETADLVMVATSVALKAGFSIDDLTNAMLEKSRKWEAVLDGKKPASGKERSAFLLDFAFGDLPDSWTTCCPDCNVMDPPYEDTGLYRRCGCCNSLSRVATWLASSKDLGFSVEA
ncbi:MAG: hypothetical protein L3J47_00335 [Sulfurovum sp.]|nr:hypothetical protein [Sulfurovum sp.]